MATNNQTTHPSSLAMNAWSALGYASFIPILVGSSTAHITYALTGASSAQAMVKLFDKIYAITVAHSNFYGSVENNLCFTKNLATRTDIWNGEDEKLGRLWVERLQIKDPKIVAPCIPGVCIGACLAVGKELLTTPIKSEAELIATVAKYKEGFSVKAAAMQIAYQAVHHEHSKEIQALYQQERKTIDTQERIRLWALIEKDHFTEELSTIAPLIDLSVKKVERIDSHKNGLYCLTSVDHAIALLILPFGTYYLDPNNGLNRWDASFKSRYKDFENCYSLRVM